jgi:hypothetical protein
VHEVLDTPMIPGHHRGMAIQGWQRWKAALLGGAVLGFGAAAGQAQNLLSGPLTFGEATQQVTGVFTVPLAAGTYEVTLTGTRAGAGLNGETIAFEFSNAENLQFNNDSFAAMSFPLSAVATQSRVISFGESITGWTLSNSLWVNSWTPELTVTITSLALTAIPEPSTYAAGVGVLVLGVAVYGRRRRRRASDPATRSR